MGFPGRRVIFIDTCRSGSAIDINGFANELGSSENGRIIVFTSATGNQNSLEPPGESNGAFTKVLLEGLKGKADYSKDGIVTLGELIPFLSEQVRRETRNAQTPTVAGRFDPALSIGK